MLAIKCAVSAVNNYAYVDWRVEWDNVCMSLICLFPLGLRCDARLHLSIGPQAKIINCARVACRESVDLHLIFLIPKRDLMLMLTRRG